MKKYEVLLLESHESFNGYDHDSWREYIVYARNKKSAINKAKKQTGFGYVVLREKVKEIIEEK